MLLFHFFIFNFRPLLAAVNAVLGDGERAVVVGDEVVGAEAAHAVWGCAANVGEEDVTSLVACGILKLVPVSNPEHVAEVIV